MGLITELGYRARPVNVFQRAVQWLASTRPGSWLFQRTLHRIDRPLFRLTKGRVTLPGVLAGLPVILLTTTGAKTGLERTMPLAGIPIGDDLAVIGSNFGQRPTPGWVHNLRACPDATVSYGPVSVAVTARPATREETEQAFRAGASIYGGFAAYRDRVADREIRVFVLEPRDESRADS
jgi:deazaflavin-dependent oxidoreductase (nitroreductase family)